MTSIPTRLELPLGAHVSAELTNNDERVLAFLMQAELPYLRQRLAGNERIPSERIDEVLLEMKRFLFLSSRGSKPLAMMSDSVDEAWHQFILFTCNYTNFCTEAFGKYIHHRPTTSFTPAELKAPERFIGAYERVFGILSDLWQPVSGDCSASTGDNSCTVGQCSGSDDD